MTPALMAVGAGIFLVAGSIMWLKPSRQDQHLSKLRQAAIILGLKIKHRKVTPQSAQTGIRESLEGTAYSWFSPNASGKESLRFRIYGQQGWDVDHLPAGFSWHDQPSTQDLIDLEQHLTLLDDDLYFLEVFDGHATMIVAENFDANADQYLAFLTSWFEPNHCTQ